MSGGFQRGETGRDAARRAWWTAAVVGVVLSIMAAGPLAAQSELPGDDPAAWRVEASVQARRISGVGDELILALQTKGALLAYVAAAQQARGETTAATRNEKLVTLCIRALAHDGEAGWVWATQARALHDHGRADEAAAALDQINNPAEQAAAREWANSETTGGQLAADVGRRFAAQWDGYNAHQAVRRDAASVARHGTLRDAQVWVEVLSDPAERAWASLGVAEGLADALPRKPRVDLGAQSVPENTETKVNAEIKTEADNEPPMAAADSTAVDTTAALADIETTLAPHPAPQDKSPAPSQHADATAPPVAADTPVPAAAENTTDLALTPHHESAADAAVSLPEPTPAPAPGIVPGPTADAPIPPPSEPKPDLPTHADVKDEPAPGPAPASVASDSPPVPDATARGELIQSPSSVEETQDGINTPAVKLEAKTASPQTTKTTPSTPPPAPAPLALAPIPVVPNLATLADTDAVLKDAAAAADVVDLDFTTTKGIFTVRVHRPWAPLAADRFCALAAAGYYHNQRFFRVVPGFVVQWGIHGYPNVAAAWRTQTLPDEPRTQPNRRGTIVFAAATKPHTRTTQVFINLADNAFLDDLDFVPFGEIIRGMDVVDSLFGGHGETPSSKQRDIQLQGNAFLDAQFPALDSIISVQYAPDP